MSGRPLKVLQVVDTLSMGGAETWLMELQRRWARTGAVVTDVLATSGNRGLFDDEVAQLGGRVHYLRFGRAQATTFLRGLRRLLREGGYDAIHDHSDYASGWHYLMGVGALPPVRVTHVHNPPLHMRANYAVTASRRATADLGRRLVLGLATHVCGTSREALGVYGFALARRRPKVSVLHCGFDVGVFSGAREADRRSVLDEFGFPPEAKIILFAGRLDRDLEVGHPRNHKNSWLAVNIARAALERDSSVRLLMAGGGDQRAEMERRIAAWGLSDQLRLLGVRQDLPRLMRASDALLFPSTEEGLGMVAVEAQAAGLPVVASTAIPREAVVIPELFHAVQLSEPVERWADTLLEAAGGLRADPRACRAAIEATGFSIENSAAALEAIYGSARR